MKKFHITIKDNETGEITHDLDTNAIVGGILDDEGSYAIGISHCEASGLFNAIRCAEKAIDMLLTRHPDLFLFKMIEKMGDETEETTETTEN